MRGFWLMIPIICFLAVTEIYILEDTALGAIIYRAAAQDPEDAVLEVIYSLGKKTSVPGSFMYDYIHT